MIGIRDRKIETSILNINVNFLFTSVHAYACETINPFYRRHNIRCPSFFSLHPKIITSFNALDMRVIERRMFTSTSHINHNVKIDKKAEA